MKKSKLITMAISLLAAICLWIYVVTVVNPEGTTTISNIPVTFSGAEVLREDQGLVLSGDYQDMVTVSFTGKNSDTKKLEQNKEEISAVVDVSKIRSTRDYTLSYDLLLPDAVPDSAVTITDRTPGNITVHVEKLVKKPVPVKGDFSQVEVAEARRTTLPNGIGLYTLASDDFEVLRISFVFRAGSALQQAPFSASAAANLLSEGSRDMTAHQIAEQLDYYGSWYDVNVDRDYAYINFATLSKFFDPTLAVAEQILLCPAFPEEELRTYAAKRRQRLAVERAKIDVKAREAFARALFGERHPYGVSSHEEAYDSLTRDDVAGFYRRFYTAENCFVVCSGRIGDHELKAVAELAGRIPRGAAEAPPAFPAPETTHTAFVEYPGAVQSSLRIGRLLFPRTHPDFLGMQVVATALGGYFGSRLMQNLREEHGYTYGVVSAMVNFEREGYFAIAAQVGADVTQEALREIYAEIERLGAEPMPEAELELVKNMMTGEMMRILDGPFGIADVTIENILCGCDNTVIGSNIRRIREMTPAGVQQLARKYLRREDLVTVVAGAEKPAGM